MASAMTYLNITELQVRHFIDTLLEKQSKSSIIHPAAYASETTAPLAATEAPAGFAAGAAAAAAAAVGTPLRLHPRVDAVHPLGEAHSSRELEAAIKMYKQIVKDSHFVIEEIMVEPDKALVTGYQIVNSRLAALPALLPLPQQWQQQITGYLPSFTASRVPTAVQLRFGKSDMGDPVVTHLSLTFSLISVLLPHLALQPWQTDILQDIKPQMINAVLSAGSLASVVEDMGTSLSATWRASSAVLQATIGRVLGELKGRLYSKPTAAAAEVSEPHLESAEVSHTHMVADTAVTAATVAAQT